MIKALQHFSVGVQTGIRNASVYTDAPLAAAAPRLGAVKRRGVGKTTAELAEKFECHRHSGARQLQNAGVKIRPQSLMTPELVAEAIALYRHDHTLAEVGHLLARSGSKHDWQGTQTLWPSSASAGG